MKIQNKLKRLFLASLSDLVQYLRLRPEAGSLNKSSSSAVALGVTQFITINAMSVVTLCCAT